MKRSAALFALATGCAWPTMPAPSSPSSGFAPAGDAVKAVGTSRVDVTPPPGPSTFGHGPDSLATDGYWTRLYCRVFAFETESHRRFVLVPCDLAAISTLLQREVAARLSDVLTAPDLVLTATHTHAGPAHYFDGRFYNDVFSSRLPGFDPAMTSFLASRIAEGVRRALEAAKPARLRWALGSTVGLTRNRSLEPFLANAEAGDICREGLAASDCSLPVEQLAVDHLIDVLVMEEETKAGGRGRPLASIAFLAMHPTVLPHTNRLFGADVFGVASRAVEREMRRARAEATGSCAALATGAPGTNCEQTLDDPLHAIVNTAEGDVSPLWYEGTREEAERVGERLAARIWAAQGAAPSAAATPLAFNARYLEVRLPGATFPGGRVCDAAELGVPVGYGASDHPTEFVFIDAFREGRLDAAGTGCQKPKLELFGFVQAATGGLGAFPHVAPLSLVRLGNRWITFVPAELTTVAGRRLREAVRREVGDGRFIVGGLANGYLQYVTTREEYPLQHYEAASNLYGPATEALLEDRFGYLARTIVRHDEPADRYGDRLGEATAFPYQLGTRRPRFPRPQGDSGEPRRALGLCRLRTAGERRYCFWWSDAPPGDVRLVDEPWIALEGSADHRPVRTCGAELPVADGVPRTCYAPPLRAPMATCDPGGAIDDRGLDFETRARGWFGRYYVWSTVVRLRDDEWKSIAAQCSHGGPCVQIVAHGPEGKDVISAPFGTNDALVSDCDEAQRRFCEPIAE